MPYRHASTNKAYLSERRRRLKAEGKCQWCGRKPALPSKKFPGRPGCRCADCAPKARIVARDRMRFVRPLFKRLGLCCVCFKNASLATTHGVADQRCAACADYQDDRKANLRAVKRLARHVFQSLRHV